VIIRGHPDGAAGVRTATFPLPFLRRSSKRSAVSTRACRGKGRSVSKPSPLRRRTSRSDSIASRSRS